MGIYYKDRTRPFHGRVRVLCGYEHTHKLEREFDVIMITVNHSDEIIDEFKKHAKILDRINPVLKLYLPENRQPTFDARLPSEQA
jgi:hypothetical protein